MEDAEGVGVLHTYTRLRNGSSCNKLQATTSALWVLGSVVGLWLYYDFRIVTTTNALWVLGSVGLWLYFYDFRIVTTTTSI